MELPTAVILFQRSILSPGAEVGLAAQVCFATFPLLDAAARLRRNHQEALF